MAMNPMQRKANMYLLIGVLVTLLITGSFIAILFMQLSKTKQEMQAEKAKLKSVKVLSSDVKSGDEITSEDLKDVKSSSAAIPDGLFDFASLEEDEKVYAKIDLSAGTVVTEGMVYKDGEKIENDLRTQEYNVFSLPTGIEDGEYIDVRLRMPNGADYIVISKKKIEIPLIGEAQSGNTVRLNISEDEIMMMSNAIVESYWARGSKLYITKYIEPGMQAQATPTYLPNADVANMILKDPNVVNVAKTELAAKYNDADTLAKTRGAGIEPALQSNIDTAKDTIQTRVDQEIESAKEERTKYLEALSGE